MTRKTSERWDTARVRNRGYTYRLAVDPDRIILEDNMQGWILDLLIKAGGTMSREDMVTKFTALMKRKRPHIKSRPTALFSTNQRILKDKGIIKVVTAHGTLVRSQSRKSWVK